ncbi:peptidylprolyl isomerase [Homoserinimonas aerilata]|uniref:peptidylprolyl isomerase n=1 Tax=Homoserinimonas aerilata TaxID=1162970 RepID=A0A542YK90_9MICO|nr:FKBP-type peptidyl-prolyl cis-trans isomerase [Homoserinimonas aerilata]TQL48481.1 peptidylprolyl isomerase [Homoserinimonas aerilata]
MSAGTKTPVRRALAVAAAVLMLAPVLAACQTPPAPDLDSAPVCAAEGAASKQVTAESELFQQPQVDFPAGLSVGTTERSVLVEGEGPEAEAGSLVTVDYVAYDARTSEQLEATAYGAEGIGNTVFRLAAGDAVLGLRRALVCSTAGSRVAAVVPAAEASALVVDSRGMADDDAIVFVFDVVAVASDYADGAAQPVPEGLPAVDDTDGRPVVTIPSSEAPSTLQIAAVRQGDGLTVREGADVAVKFVGLLWRNGLLFEENWSNRAPEMQSSLDFLPGFTAAIVGQEVGSRMLVVVPPEDGYGPDGDSSGSITGTDTLVYVIDILATT